MYSYSITADRRNRPTVSSEQYAAERDAALARIRAKRRAERRAQAERSVSDLDEAIMQLNARGTYFPQHANTAARWEHYAD